MAEFDLIRQLQKIICVDASAGMLPAPVIGIGDDAAVLALPDDSQLVVTTDTLVEGVHFSSGTLPFDLGHKALAVNLSDLAAMGADPAWFFLAITLPAHDAQWLHQFAQGMAELAANFGIHLAGGDTTSGPLSITITALGLVPAGQALRRSGAKTGDLVVVSGSLGDAAYALQQMSVGNSPDIHCSSALHKPVPRLELGCRLRGLATSCIDVSDGFLADLGHILQASGQGAEIELEHLPCSASLEPLEDSERLRLLTTGGDDYELCFTIPSGRCSELKKIEKDLNIRLTVTGKITVKPGLRCKTADGQSYRPTGKGYEHFSQELMGR